MGWNENSTSQETTIAGITRHGFTGQEGLDNLGLVNLNGRIYDYSGLLFLSADPNIPYPTDTRSYNRYAYARYNPLTYTDPTGFDDGSDGGDTGPLELGPPEPRYPSPPVDSGPPADQNLSTTTNTGSSQGDSVSEVVVTASTSTSIGAQLWPITVTAFNSLLLQPQQSFWSRLLSGFRRVSAPALAAMIVVTVLAPEGPGEVADAGILGTEGAGELVTVTHFTSAEGALAIGEGAL